jgi:hypothetical protein
MRGITRADFPCLTATFRTSHSAYFGIPYAPAHQAISGLRAILSHQRQRREIALYRTSLPLSTLVEEPEATLVTCRRSI